MKKIRNLKCIQSIIKSVTILTVGITIATAQPMWVVADTTIIEPESMGWWDELVYGDFKYRLIYDGQKATITAYTGDETKISIPEQIDGKIVTEIDNHAFRNCSSLKNIEIPASVTAIQANAFEYCSSLTEIEIPEKVSVIGESAFRGCNSLEKISVAKDNKKYDSREDCNAIIETADNKLIVGCNNTKIPDDITEIGDSAFRGSGVENIEIPSSVIKIGDHAFSVCKNLKSIKIPSGVKEIPEYAFRGCISLENIELPSEITYIGDYAFRNCSSLKSIDIPAKVNHMGYYNEVFYGCSSLERISVSEENEKYDSREDCNAIIDTTNNELIVGCKTTKIPESVCTIAENAFNGSGIERIKIPSGVTEIKMGAFSECHELKNIDISSGVTKIERDTFMNCNKLTDIKIPESVTEINCHAFSGCTGLTAIEIPKSVTNIYSSFYGCDNLEQIKVDAENEVYDSRGDCNAVIESDSNKLVVGCKNTKIPSDVTIIGAYAFRGCSGLTYMEIPEGVTDIQDWAFEGCVDLKDIKIPLSVKNIEERAFFDCVNLKKVELSSNITSIGQEAFGYYYDRSKWEVVGEDDDYGDNENDSFYYELDGFTIKCDANSEAEKYAKNKKFKIEYNEEPSKPTTIKLNKTKVSTIVGGKVELKASVESSLSDITLKWSSSDKKVAAVTSKGIITGKKSGNVIITVITSDGKKATCKVTVKAAPKKITLNKKSITLKKGKSYKLKYTITKNTYTTITFESNNKKVAIVDSNGKIKALKKGKAIITAKTANGKTAKCKVTVNK